MPGLFDNFYFDPTSYGGSQGILGMLSAGGPNGIGNNQPSPLDNAQWPAGPVGAPLSGNQPSPLDTAQWPSGPMGAPPSVPDYGQTSNMQIGSGPNAYMMPIFGSPPAQDSAALPPNAQPTSGQMPQGMQQPVVPPSFLPQENPGIGDRLSAGLASLANSRGSGLVGALSSGISGFASGQRNDPQGVQQQNLRAQYASLVPILGPQKAMLAILNPDAGKTLLSEALTNKEEYKQTGEDAFGNKQFGFVNNREQTVNGQPINAPGAQSGAGGGFLAPGVAQMDSSLNGKDYLNQFSPEVKAAVQDFVDGKSMPTGNPRKGFTQAVKMIAQKYGQDIGQPVDDASYSARRTMRNQLSSAAPSSLGGQINIGNTAAAHLADLTERALALDNKDLGFTWGTHAINAMRGLSTEQAAKMEALKGAAQHYGQEITKFYAGSPGGVAERDRFLETIDGAKSPKELASVLQTEAQLMHGRLTTLGDQISGVLGPDGTKQYPVIRPEGEAALKKIEENVSKLRSGGGANPGIGTGPVAAVPQQAAAALQQNPALAAQFDAKYGAGASKKILGGH